MEEYYLEPAVQQGWFCFANWLAVGFIRDELLGKNGLPVSDFAFGLSLNIWLPTAKPEKKGKNTQQTRNTKNTVDNGEN